MPKAKKDKEPKVWSDDDYSPGQFKFIRETDKLIDAGLWEETTHQVHHRFGNLCFISYSRPKTNLIRFRLAGKSWRDQSA